MQHQIRGGAYVSQEGGGGEGVEIRAWVGVTEWRRTVSKQPPSLRLQ